MLKKKFTIGSIAVAGFIALMIAALGFAMQQTKVGGPQYGQIVQGKDLIADILPPPVFVIEAFLNASQAAKKPEDLEERAARFKALREEYGVRQKVWSDSGISPELKAQMEGPVAQAAERFFGEVEQGLFPTIRSGDTASIDAAYERVAAEFAAHRAAVDVAVKTASDGLVAAEAKAGTWSLGSSILSIVGGLLIVSAVVAGALLVTRSVFTPLAAMTDLMVRLARGDSDFEIKGADRKDEIGSLARALKVFRDQSIELDAAAIGARDSQSIIAAAGRVQAMIEFDVAGNILNANDNFLATTGYALEEIRGRHHSIFCDKDYVSTSDYKDFWRRLGSGESNGGKYERVGKGGVRLILQGTYTAILDSDGKPYKVVKFASDITAAEAAMAEQQEAERSSAELQAHVVSETGSGLTALAAGDLSYRINADFPGQYGALKADFNAAIGKLEEAMSVITANASGIQTGAGEISQAADDLSRRTEQQAATLEQTAAALDQITATVRRTAEGAQRANVVVTDARSDAEASGQVVARAVSAMGQIENSSSQISQIIGVIDEIAFQTNLLALNAGVEAARAGDAGRGFAVVASEVRALAQRSAEAAKEIKVLISASSGQVREGVSLVGQTGEALSAIVSRVSEINTLMAEINASAQEQATALSQVNTAVNQMDQTTQQNAAMVEQSTAASHNLTQEAGELGRLVSRFQLSGGAAPRAAAVQAPARRTGSGQPTPIQQAHSRISDFASRQSAPRRVANGGAAAAVSSDSWEEF